jgi:hypothetical protein
MTSFAPAAAQPRVVPLDPTKHVNYTSGMVLGVDDFEQEFSYHQARARWLTRDLIGFGTVWGLAIGFEPSVDDVTVTVSPGTAVSPCGELICVSPTQCASLNRWLEEHAVDVIERVGSPLEPLDLSVVACYRECKTDDVPIPGEPCRTTEELMAASRVMDSFRLEFRLDRPEQPDEDAITDLIAWLRRIPIVSGPGTPLDEFADEVRKAIRAATVESPPASPPDGGPPLLLGSPPGVLEIPAADVTGYLRTALRVWVTDGRPLLRRCGAGCECGCAGGCGCAQEPGTPADPCDDAVLLGELRLTLEQPPAGGVRLAPGGWALDESRRPFLLPVRLLQELGLGESAALDLGSPPGSGPSWAGGAPAMAGARVNADGTTEFAYGGLQVEHVDGPLFRLFGWPGAVTPHLSVVTGTPITDSVGYAFEVIDPGPTSGAELYVRVRRRDGKPGTTSFMVQVTDYSGVA